jgi:protein-tyrosine-phosphatase
VVLLTVKTVKLPIMEKMISSASVNYKDQQLSAMSAKMSQKNGPTLQFYNYDQIRWFRSEVATLITKMARLVHHTSMQLSTEERDPRVQQIERTQKCKKTMNWKKSKY